MRLNLFIVFILVILTNCKQEEFEIRHDGVGGIVQNGPFLRGANITVQELDQNYNPSGKSYSLMTTDNLGSFSLENRVSSNYIEVIAAGYYFNGISGGLSEAPLTLRAICSLEEDKAVNVNILTTLTKDRILYLIKNEQKTFGIAKEQAYGELLKIFNIDVKEENFFDMEKSKKEGILLAVLSVFQGNNSVGELSEFISEFCQDFKDDGELQSSVLIYKIKYNARNIDINSIRSNLSRRYSELGLEIDVPLFELYVKRLCPLSIVQTSPVNLQIDVEELDTIKIFFNKPIKITQLENNILLKENNRSVPVNYTYNSDDFELSIIPKNGILPEKSYVLTLNSQLQAVDEDYLVNGYNLSFDMVNVDIVSNLLALYSFDGNTKDMSGNNNDAVLNGGRYCKDIKGKEDSALEFLKMGDYLQMPNFNLSTNCWTYSIWVYLDNYPKYQAIILGTSSSGNPFSEMPFYIGGISRTLFSYNGWQNAKLSPQEGRILELKRWNHLVMIMNNKKVRFYVNGHKTFERDNYEHYDSPSTFAPLDSSCDGKLYISAKEDYGESTEYIGLMDNVRFYRRALNNYEVKQIYEKELQ